MEGTELHGEKGIRTLRIKELGVIQKSNRREHRGKRRRNLTAKGTIEAQGPPGERVLLLASIVPFAVKFLWSPILLIF
jgi:hypothetical protein